MDRYGGEVFTEGEKPVTERKRTRLPPSVLRVVYGAEGKKQHGVRKSNASGDRIVNRACMDKRDQGIQKARREMVAAPPPLAVFMGRGFDETKMWVGLSAEQSQVVQRALIDKIHGASRLLSDQDKDRLLALIEDLRNAWVNIMVQKGVLAWGHGEKQQSPIVANPIGLQNNRASTILNGDWRIAPRPCV